MLHYYFKMHKIPLASLSLIEIEKIERKVKLLLHKVISKVIPLTILTTRITIQATDEVENHLNP